jgi:ribosome-binding factor A
VQKDSKRVQQAESQVQQIVANYLLRGCRLPLKGIVTVSKVKMPGDLKSARVFISVLGSAEDLETSLGAINDERVQIQRHLSKELPMRYCPVLSFHSDETTEYILKIESLLSQIHSPNPQ